MEDYVDSQAIRPTILAIAGAIPLVGNLITGADAALTTRVHQQQQENLEYLIECLESGRDDFGGPIAIQRSDPVIHAAYVTIQATLRTSRREKIRAFAMLLRAGLEDPPRLDLEQEHEDYLKILDDLSVRELQILWLLGEIENKYPPSDDESDEEIDWFDRHWSEFERIVVSKTGTPQEELPGLLVRLARTGLYEPLYHAVAGGPSIANGRLTGAYRRLASLLGKDPHWFDTGSIVP